MAPTMEGLRRFAAAALFAVTAGMVHAVDATWNYAVQVSARIVAEPLGLVLSWPEDTTADQVYSPDYVVYRRPSGSTTWGVPVRLGAGVTTYRDNDVVEGRRYEYQIVREYRDPRYPLGNRDAYGYIIAGINVPMEEHRGRIILVVEEQSLNALSQQIATFRRDLAGDGWVVTQLVCGASESPSAVRQRIRQEYVSGGAAARALILLGHVPVVRSGAYAPDGHERRSMPADTFYGDMDGTWTDTDGDGTFDHNTIPSDVELEVGRVDFSGLAGIGSGLSEHELLARYLEKNHAYRYGNLRFQQRAIIGDRTGIDRGRAPAASGFRAFSALYGADAIVQASTDDVVPAGERWSSMLQSGSYGWAFGSGGGDFDRLTFLGTHGEYDWAISSDMLSAKAGFYLVFGSYVVDWAHSDNLLRAALAAPEGGLGGAWSGRPGFIFHGLGLGDTIGVGVRLTQNNNGFYHSPTNAFRRGVHIAWMGDPTLRMNAIPPPTLVMGRRQGSAVVLSWQAAGGESTYHVYRGNSENGPFTRLTTEPISSTEFNDTSAGAGGTYLVRAVAMQTTASGSYLNLSQGEFWSDATSTPMPNQNPPSVKLGLPLMFTPRPEEEMPGPGKG